VYLDAENFLKNGEQLSTLSYIKNTYGPTPNSSFLTAKDSLRVQKKIVTKKKGKINYYKLLDEKFTASLGAADLSLINEVVKKYGALSPKKLSDISHNDPGWLVAKKGKRIDMSLAIHRSDENQGQINDEFSKINPAQFESDISDEGLKKLFQLA